MKILFFIISILCSIPIGFSQNISGEIIYKVNPPQNIIKYVDTTGFSNLAKKVTIKRFNEIKRGAPYLTFYLKFTKDEILFERLPSMSNDNGIDLNRIAIALDVADRYYVDQKQNILYREFQGPKIKPQKTWLVKDRINSFIEWKITNKTKIIQGYKCQKAIAQYNLGGIKKINLTAWFYSDLPMSIGPLEAVGLPGVVLELKRNHYTYYAYKINIGKTKVKINHPSIEKTITEKEFVLDRKKYFKRLRTPTK